MVRTPAEVSEDIISALRAVDPLMSAHVGSPERKIIDAVASVVSASYINSQVTGSIWDVDTRAGVELDELCGLFGFGRREGVQAVGVLSFQLAATATSEYVIPAGTIASTIGTDSMASVSFETLFPVVISAGAAFARIDAQCTEAGVLGNVAANTIVQVEGLGQVAAVWNDAAFTGGIDAETDEELRSRFKQTFLRNLAGTEDFYAALCLSQNTVSRVRVIGPVERYREQLEVTAGGINNGGVATSQIECSRWAWPHGTIVSRGAGTPDERYFTEGQHYTVNQDSPKIKVQPIYMAPASDTTGVYPHVGDILEVEHEYVSTASRNDPPNQITNCVDIYVDGGEGTQVVENGLSRSETIASTGVTFQDDYGRNVTTGRFQRLAYGPVLTLPEQIIVNGVTYTQATSASDTAGFRLIRQTGVMAGSTRAISGILWGSQGIPADGYPMEITYSYNRVPLVLDELLRVSKQIGTDVMVHEATPVRMSLAMVVQLDPGYTLSDVKAAVEAKLREWFASLPYGAWIQFSDMHAVVRQVIGVDNARMKKQADGGEYGISLWSRNGLVKLGTRTGDFRLLDNELPVFEGVFLTQRAENTFGE